MSSRSKPKDDRIIQAEMFSDSPVQPETSGVSKKAIEGSVVVEPLGKGVRVTGRDAAGSVLWGFVATRTMLEQPHGSIAIYDRLRELLNDSLANLGLPTARPEDVIAAAEAQISELERLAANLRKKIAVAKGKKPTDGQLDKARDVYRAAHDVLLWMSQETSIGRTADDTPVDAGGNTID
jgi:hypothetical protein